MLRSRIDELFTEKVAEFLRMGFVVSTETMRGSEGEIAKVDLTNGKVAYRVLLKTGWNSEYLVGGDSISLILGRIPEEEFKSKSVWNNHLKVLEMREFHIVSKKTGWCVEGKRGLEVMSLKRLGRYQNRSEKVYEFNKPGIEKIVLEAIRRREGFKGTKLYQVSKVYKTIQGGEAAYYVEARGTRFRLK